MDRHLLIPGLEHIEAEPDWKRLRQVLLREMVPDRIPSMELIVDDEIVQTVLGRPISGFLDYVEFHLRMGYDTVSMRISPNFAKVYHESDDTAALNKDKRDWAAGSGGLVRTRSDFDSYQWPDVDSSLASRFEQAAGVLPEGMGVTLRSSGVLDNMIKVMSYEGMSEALYDDPDLVKDVADRVGEMLYRTFEQIIDCDCVVGSFFGDDLGFRTGTLISPTHIRAYVLPWLKRIADLTHDRGKFVLLHCCGNGDVVMDDLIDFVGIDGKHSYEDAIMPVTEVKQRYGDRISIIGGVDMDVLARRSPDEVDAYVTYSMSAHQAAATCSVQATR